MKLLAVKDLTLHQAVTVDMYRTVETVAATGQNMTKPGGVHAVKKTTYQPKKKVSAKPTSKPKCCSLTVHTKSPCRVAGKMCTGCESMGHFQSMCPDENSEVQEYVFFFCFFFQLSYDFFLVHRHVLKQ